MWPHQFTKKGKEIQVGEERAFLDETSTTMRPKYAQPMVCVHCGKEFMQGQQSPPIEQCPARNEKREMKRIRSDVKT